MNEPKETRVNLIKISLAATVLCAAAPPAMASPAEDTFNAFRHVCGDTHADYAAAVSAAGQSGWKSSDASGSGMPGMTVIEKTALTKSAGNAALILSLTRGTANKGAVNISTCTVQTNRGSGFADLQAQAQTWFGFAPHDTSASAVTYRFTDDNGAPKAVADTDIDSAAAGAGMMIVTIKKDGSNATLDYVKIKK
jgi:hypothetical protein